MATIMQVGGSSGNSVNKNGDTMTGDLVLSGGASIVPDASGSTIGTTDFPINNVLAKNFNAYNSDGVPVIRMMGSYPRLVIGVNGSDTITGKNGAILVYGKNGAAHWILPNNNLSGSANVTLPPATGTLATQEYVQEAIQAALANL